MNKLQKKPIVFLPGWGLSPYIFKPLAKHLEDHPQYFMHLPALDTQKQLHQQICIPNDSILIGWSLGGLIATLICANEPYRFSKLILLNSTPKFVAECQWPGISTEQSQKFLTQFEQNPSHLLTEYFAKLCAWPSKDKRLHQHIKQHTLENKARLESQLHFLLNTDARSEYYQLKTPRLEIRSLDDPLIPSNHPNLQCHHILAGGHSSFLNHIEQCIGYIRRFIDEPSYYSKSI